MAVGVPMAALYAGHARSAAGAHNADAAGVTGEGAGPSGAAALVIGGYAVTHESMTVGASGDGNGAKTYAKSAIDRHLRNLIPDQQQQASSNQSQDEPSIATRKGTEVVHPRIASESPAAERPISTNPFDPGFVESAAPAARAVEESSAVAVVPPVGDGAIAKSSLAEGVGVAGKEGSRERALAPELSAGDGGHGEDEMLWGARGRAAEEARAELKRFVGSERGRGHFLQVVPS